MIKNTPEQDDSPGIASYAGAPFAEIEIDLSAENGAIGSVASAESARRTASERAIDANAEGPFTGSGSDHSTAGGRLLTAAYDPATQMKSQNKMTEVAAGAERAAILSHANPLASKPQSIKQKEADPIKQKFYEMRTLALGNPFAMRDAGLFYKQAKFMEDFSDDCQEEEPMFMYYPHYQLMGYRQLRTYFTWRTKARQGNFHKTSLSYIFLYLYELLSNVGVSSPYEGLHNLFATWLAYRATEPALDDYLPAWLKDYHIYYPLPHDFLGFVKNHALWKFYPELFAIDAGPEESLALWNNISAYDVTKSNFYNADNADAFRNCFHAVLSGVRALCKESDIPFEDLLIYRTVYRGTPWHPFRRAMFYPWLTQANRQVEMPGQEKYYCSHNSWTANLSLYHAGRKDFVGYLIKKTEACLRQAMNYKYKITADPGVVYPYFQKLKAIGITIGELDSAIERSVTDFHRDIHRTVVTVDLDSLARIRQEALGTQHKLIVPDAVEPEMTLSDAIPLDPLSLPTDVPTRSSAALLPVSPEQLTQELATSMSVSPISIPPEQTPTPAADGWAALKAALSPTEREALIRVSQGNFDLKAYADENGVMPEVLADGINEKAADHIGDNLLDTCSDMVLYDEYKAKVTEMLG